MANKKLNIFLCRRDILIEDLLSIDRMIKGCYCVSKTKCGKPNCKCAKGDEHRVERLVWREDGRGINRAVPKEDIEWVKEMTDNHNEYKRLRKKLEELDEKIAQQLDTLYTLRVKKSKQGKRYLNVGK